MTAAARCLLDAVSCATCVYAGHQHSHCHWTLLPVADQLQVWGPVLHAAFAAFSHVQGQLNALQVANALQVLTCVQVSPSCRPLSTVLVLMVLVVLLKLVLLLLWGV